MHGRSVAARLADVAEDQWGLVTRRQVEAAEVPRATLARATAPGSGVLERVAHGVYRLVGSPVPDHVELRAAWLQLAPDVPAWDRGDATRASPDRVSAGDGAVVSHRSAAALSGLGHLPADVHEFTVAERRQTRRPDVRLHVRRLEDDERVVVAGLPVTRPARVAADLLAEREDPGAVGQIVADALRAEQERREAFETALASLAARYGHPRGDGAAALRWLLDLAGAGGAA
jgi:predicted transcriptional regulator of viral defense system